MPAILLAESAFFPYPYTPGQQAIQKTGLIYISSLDLLIHRITASTVVSGPVLKQISESGARR